ncbi:MAG: RsmE family RNA methyltransferase [Eubacteriales bacterium]|nr:RsmE family RNA methyltransferase [Eubacteriales bacterium]
MRRFYADSRDIRENSIIISGDEASHIKNVVRMQTGDTFIAFDGSGTDYACRITDIGKHVEADIISKERNLSEPHIGVTLYQAYPKSAKMEEIVQKAIELGTAGIVPFISKRCVKKPDKGNDSRLERIALAAVKQCGRSVLPEVTAVQNFDGVLELMKNHALLIVCWEEEKKTSLKQALAGDASDIGIVIGPEGGFDADEVERIKNIGGISATLGRRIMRTETAGVAVLSAIFYEKGQMQY